MKRQGGIGQRRWLAFPVLGVIALLAAALAPAKTALAHPLDVYLQASYLTVEPEQIVVELDLTPGVLLAPQVLPEIDTDGDEQISDVEAQAYVNAILSNVVVQVDGETLALTITNIDMPDYLNIQAGYGTIRIFTTATLASGITGTHQISYANNFAPTGASYQVNTFVNQGDAIALGTQNRDDTQQSMTVDFTIGGAVAAGSDGASGETSASASGQAQRLLAYFDIPSLSAWQLLVALGLAVVLGGLHALTPGHGKTLVAAYLVGSRGTVRHAVALGAIVTFTHTASVIVIGLIALFASHWIMPDVLVPVLEIVSGALVVILGTRLVWQRWNAYRRRQVSEREHAHAHAHGLDHHHDHTHLPPEDGFRVRNLVAMGVSGGLVPCPEALGIMIIAVGLNRVVLGLGLIVSFSLGLAAVLMALGILLVRSRSLIERFSGGISGRLSHGLSLGSAALVTVLGIGITFGGFAAYLR